MGGPSREVTIRFNGDFSDARKEMAAYAKDVKKFNEDLWKIEKARADDTEKAVSRKSKAETTAAKEAVKATKEAERAEKQRYAEIERMDRRQFQSRMKAIADRERAEKRAIAEIERAEKQRAAEVDRMDRKQFAARMKAIADREKAEQRAIQNAARAQKAYEGKERRAYGQELKVDRFAEGAVRQFAGAGKNAMMISGMSEQDTEKMLRNLIKIQLVYETILGAKEGIEMLQRAWRAYSYSVKLAAEAHAALAVAQAAGGGVSGAARGGVRGAAGGIAGNIAGGAAGGAGVSGAAAAGGAGIMPWAGAIAGGGLGIVSAGLTTREAMKYGIGGGATPGSYVDSVGGSDWNPFGWLFGGGAKMARNRSTKRLGGMEKSRSAEQERLGRYQENLQRDYGFSSARQGVSDQSRVGRWGSRLAGINTDEATGGNTYGRADEAQRIRIEEEAISAKASKERAALQEKRANQETVNAAIDAERQAIERSHQARLQEIESQKEALSLERQIASTAEQAASGEYDRAFASKQQAEDRNKAGADAWNSAGPGMQRRMMAVKRKLEGGGELSRAEEQVYQQSGLSQQNDLRDLHEQQSMKKAERTGYGGFAGDANKREAQFYEAQRQDADRRQNEQHNITVKIDGQIRSTNKDVEAAIKANEANLQKLIKASIEEAMKNWKSSFDDKTSGAGEDKKTAFDFSGRMAAVQGQV